MLVHLTNARTNKAVIINPAVIGDIQERNDEKYPDTKCALVKIDGSFIPIKEDIDTVSRLVKGASRGIAQTTAAPSRMREPESDDPGPQER